MCKVKEDNEKTAGLYREGGQFDEGRQLGSPDE
jgi:hypothetical protein